MNEEIKEQETTVEPWGIQFTWKDKSVKITLKNGEDMFKIAEMLSALLKSNGIENDFKVM